MPDPSAPLRLLVIEDEAPIRRFLRAGRDADSTLIEAGTAAAGLQAAARSRPDLVLLDLGLPDGDGLDVLREIRESAGAEAHHGYIAEGSPTPVA